MKLGISSYSFKKHMENSKANYIDICSEAKRIGYDGIEFIDLSLKVQASASQEELAEEIKEHCDKIGLEIIAYTIAADFLNKGQEEVERIKHQADIAAILGAKVLRHDATWSLPEGISWREAIGRMKAPIREVTEYAATLGIRTCTENHGLVLQDAQRVEDLILAVDHPNYGWLVDMGNFLCVDQSALHAMPIAAPYAFHVHAKDFLYKPAWETSPGNTWFSSRNGSHLRGTVAGDGVVPIAWCIDVLKKSGYQGWLSYEFEGMEDCLPAIEAGYQFLRPLVKAV
ncbi:MAG: sugar phosphate isomerase/epimerase [Clostridiales bacterium]|nr:sugar phosphate isomerase/epimerase [Clostridiales bacterium]